MNKNRWVNENMSNGIVLRIIEPEMRKQNRFNSLKTFVKQAPLRLLDEFEAYLKSCRD